MVDRYGRDRVSRHIRSFRKQHGLAPPAFIRGELNIPTCSGCSQRMAHFLLEEIDGGLYCDRCGAAHKARKIVQAV